MQSSAAWRSPLCLAWGCPPSRQQGTPTGTISGYIVDPHGLAVPGARVVVESVDTGATRSGSANQQGVYSVPAQLHLSIPA